MFHLIKQYLKKRKWERSNVLFLQRLTKGFWCHELYCLSTQPCFLLGSSKSFGLNFSEACFMSALIATYAKWSIKGVPLQLEELWVKHTGSCSLRRLANMQLTFHLMELWEQILSTEHLLHLSTHWYNTTELCRACGCSDPLRPKSVCTNIVES